jgi:hypothetical protein
MKYIFDLDGTIALMDHRRHILETDDPKKWDMFFDACVNDVPNIPVIFVMQELYRAGHKIAIWSGRSDRVKKQTVEWLKDRNIRYHELKMRRDGDYTPDDTLKMNWYISLDLEQKEHVAAVFDDRDKVVAMWRRIGVPCFQVAEGDF